MRGGPFTPGAELVINAGYTRLRVADLPGADQVLLAAATYFHDRRPLSALQLTWEVDGAFPGDPGYPYDEGVQPRPWYLRGC